VKKFPSPFNIGALLLLIFLATLCAWAQTSRLGEHRLQKRLTTEARSFFSQVLAPAVPEKAQQPAGSQQNVKL